MRYHTVRFLTIKKREVVNIQLQNDCGAWINRLSHKVKKRLNATLADLGITGVQSRVLHYILIHAQEGPVYQRDVESAFELSRSTTTGILQLLERDGLLTRESVECDARLKSLIPAPRAAEIDAQVRDCIREIEGQLLRGIPPEDIQRFLEIAAKMSENLDH